MKTYLKDLTPEEIIKRLKNGEIIKNEDCDDIIKYYDGVIYIAYKSGGYGINTAFLTDSSCEYYFETEEPFEIWEPGVYKVRDGRKAFVSRVFDDYIIGIIEGDDELISWNYNGFVSNNKRENNQDIISKWED